MTEQQIEVLRVEIAKLELGPGDVLVISYPPTEDASLMRDRWEASQALERELGHRVLIGTTDVKVSVLRVMVEGDL